jgi:hypothetical protein
MYCRFFKDSYRSVEGRKLQITEKNQHLPKLQRKISEGCSHKVKEIWYKTVIRFIALLKIAVILNIYVRKNVKRFSVRIWVAHSYLSGSQLSEWLTLIWVAHAYLSGSQIRCTSITSVAIKKIMHWYPFNQTNIVAS